MSLVGHHQFSHIVNLDKLERREPSGSVTYRVYTLCGQHTNITESRSDVSVIRVGVEDVQILGPHGTIFFHHEPADVECESCILMNLQREADRAAVSSV